ncbi:rubrerythrin [Clostridium botulinum]|nr:rubrerythrin [Clostridium botulinum]
MKLRNGRVWGIYNENYCEEMLAVVKKHCSVDVINDRKEYIIAEIDRIYYCINDNGREFNIDILNKEKYYNIPYSTDLIKNPDPIDVGLWLVSIFKNKKIDFSHRYSKDELERLRKYYNI